MQLSQWIYAITSCNPILFGLALRSGQVVSRLLSHDGWFTTLPGPLQGWSIHRDFPALAKKSFRQLWDKPSQD